WFLMSSVVTVGSALLATSLSVLGGYGLSRYVLPGRRAISYTLLMSRVLPGTLVVIPLFVLFQSLRILDTPLAVILANCTAIVPFTTLLMKSYFDGVPRELDEAALVDGCSRRSVLFRVILPVSLPGLAACLGFAATAAWTDLLFSKAL